MLRCIAAAGALAAGAAMAEPITDEASAVREAKKYTKAQCTETPCTYTVKREGSQWNVWVEFTRRAAPGQKPQPYHGGHVILYFDNEGRMVRRIKGE